MIKVRGSWTALVDRRANRDTHPLYSAGTLPLLISTRNRHVTGCTLQWGLLALLLGSGWADTLALQIWCTAWGFTGGMYDYCMAVSLDRRIVALEQRREERA